VENSAVNIISPTRVWMENEWLLKGQIDRYLPGLIIADELRFLYARHVCRVRGLKEIPAASSAGRQTSGKGVTGNGGV